MVSSISGYRGVHVLGPGVDASFHVCDSSETDEESNFDLYLAPRIDVVADLVRTKLDAYYQPYYRYRTDPSDIQNEDEFYHSLGLNMDHEFTEQSKIRLWEKFDLTDDPAVEEGAITIRVSIELSDAKTISLTIRSTS